jgi:hypothetical protein
MKNFERAIYLYCLIVSILLVISSSFAKLQIQFLPILLAPIPIYFGLLAFKRVSKKGRISQGDAPFTKISILIWLITLGLLFGLGYWNLTQKPQNYQITGSP